MIINIPLSIPDELLENTIAKDYEAKITENLSNEVRKILKDHDIRYYGSAKNEKYGLESWIGNKIDDILKEYKDDIIEAAADKLSERLARTKKGKALLGGE